VGLAAAVAKILVLTRAMFATSTGGYYFSLLKL
jgi:hypothetical protein